MKKLRSREEFLQDPYLGVCNETLIPMKSYKSTYLSLLINERKEEQLRYISNYTHTVVQINKWLKGKQLQLAANKTETTVIVFRDRIKKKETEIDDAR